MSRIYEPLADLKPADMPERKHGFWKMAGPGAVLVGLSIGAGEIIIWPRTVCQYGGGVVWAAALGVFIQLWINLEIGRWSIATGETIYTGYSRVWRGFAPLFILMTILGWLAPGWGRASGLALKALLLDPHWHMQRVPHPQEAGQWVWKATDFFGTDTFWTMITFSAVALLLFGPKVVYQSVEKSVELLVAVITVGLLSVAFAVGTADTWKELGAGLLNVGHREGMAVKPLFIAIVFAGAGGTANLFYSFYLRDKHIGMGERVPSLLNPLRGRTEKMPATGFRYEDTGENHRRFRAWWDYLVKDQLLFFWFLNTLTILLFIFGALAVLRPRGIVPEAGTLIWDEAVVLGSEEVWGGPGRVVFLLVGVATLFSTQLALVDGVARSLSDIIYTNFRGARSRDVSWWYLLATATWIIAGCALTYVMEARGISELGFLLNASYMGGFAMAVYVPLTLYINRRYLPPSARPGWLCVLMNLIASAVYVGFAAACIGFEAGWW
ncbi:MAG: Nramp family divalent metal transporter [Planctomycetes bacterium]|nr:Nramp family divalent metal transporter [Planctomycetota bacterium]